MDVFGFLDSLSLQFLLLNVGGEIQKSRNPGHNKFSGTKLEYKGKGEGEEMGKRKKCGTIDTNISILLINMFPGCNHYPL